jgi:hypothetical protein
VRPAGEHAALLGTHRLGQPGAARRLEWAPALPSRGRRADSNLSRYYKPPELNALRSSGRYTFKTLTQGAATSVYVATSPLLNGVVGRYFENCQEDTPDDPTAAGTDAAGVAAYALDPEAAERLWPCPSR